ncbi:MAG: hypothetical protein ABGY75_15955, partial [Gemmataceae bacterium]
MARSPFARGRNGTFTAGREIVIFRLSSLLTAVVAVLVLPGGAVAQTKPFAIAGVGTGPQGLPFPGQPARPHNIVGLATHLGLHTGAGELLNDSIDSFDPVAGVITGKFHGSFTFERMNGDKMVCDYGNTAKGAALPGEYTITVVGASDAGLIVTAFFVAEFMVDPAASTGK